MSLYNFGSGTLFGIPNGGNLATNPTPISFGTIQDVTVDISSDNKELYGQNQYPVDVARGKSKISWKAKFAQLNGKMVNDLFFAETIATPMTTVAIQEAGTPATNVITTSHSATWTLDLGVSYVSTGVALVKVASAPTAGQYSVSAGVYTFNATDNVPMLVSYQYTAAAGVGSSFTVSNRIMGYSPSFMLVLANQYQAQTFQLTLFSCRATKLSLATKNDDYTVPEFDGSAFANAAGQVIKWDIIGQ